MNSMLTLKSCSMNPRFDSNVRCVELQYDLLINSRRTDLSVTTMTDINRIVCEELLFGAFEITLEELKEAFPEKFI